MLYSLINKILGVKKNVETKPGNPDKKLGISLYHEKKYKEAQKIFEKLKDESPTSENRFLVSVTLLKRGMMDMAINMFNEAISTYELDVNNIQHSIPNMKIQFANVLIERNNFLLAFELLKEVGNAYCKYKILDDHFLFMRGMPFFIDYLEALNKIQNKVNKINFNELVNKLESELGKDGNFLIDEIIRKNK